MLEREYQDIVTPVGKHKVKIKKWLTGRERRDISSILLEGIDFSSSQLDDLSKEVNPEGKVKDSSNYTVKGSLFSKMQDKKIELVIESVDEKTEDILNTVLNMHSADFDFINEKIAEISDGMTPDEKKSAETNTPS